MLEFLNDSLGNLGTNTSTQTAIVILSLCAVCLGVLWYLRRIRVNRLITAEQRRDDAEKRAEDDDSLSAKWEAYSRNYEVYILLNINQNKFIFYSSFLMIFAGMVLIVWGVIQNNQSSGPITDSSSLAVIISGAVTQLIAGTILVVYRFVFDQTLKHLDTMKEFISMGIAMEMLDNLPGDDDEKGLKSQTTADMAKLVIAHQLGTPITQKSTEKTKANS